MCKFFSFISDGTGGVLFLDANQRQLAIKKELFDSTGNIIEFEKCDSHAAISSFYKLDEDKVNKYEFDPTTEILTKDQINTTDDSILVDKWCKSLTFKFINDLKNNNSGHYNSGNYNSGDCNSGNGNSGNYNSGYRNSGDRNSGDRNSGDCNSGYRNSGDRNSGNYNSGDCNSGYRNSGDRNSGNYNSGHYNSGLFNTNEPNVRLFNKQTKVSRQDQRIQDVLHLGPNSSVWISWNNMSDLEKKNNPKAYVPDGYLKTIPYKEAWCSYWKDSNQETKDKFLNLPFFDCKIFEEITGIDVRKEFKDFKSRKKSSK